MRVRNLSDQERGPHDETIMAATMLRQLFVFAAVGILLANVSMANAEHRVALVINNSGQQNAAGEVASRDVGPLVTGLKKLGFQCQVVESLDETKLNQTMTAKNGER